MNKKLQGSPETRAEYYQKQAVRDFPDIEYIDFSDLHAIMARMQEIITEIEETYLKDQNKE